MNHVFRSSSSPNPSRSPSTSPLEPVRDARRPVGPDAVVLLGADTRRRRPPQRRRAWRAARLEAADVAAVVRAALREGWPVTRRDRPDGRHGAGSRAGSATSASCCPARTSLGQLEDALDAAGIPYRAETSSLVYSTREIRDLLVVLQAVDDPTDELALVSALRSPLFGCGDDDLYTFKVEHGGQLEPPGAAARVAAARPPGRRRDARARRVARRPAVARRRASCSTASCASGACSRSGSRTAGRATCWRRVRFVVDQARAFAEAEGGSLRDFLAWADLQSTEGARVVETVLPETDDDAVRILTIHGAKGLEFPITIVSGMTTRAAPRPPRGVQLAASRTTPTPTRCASRRGSPPRSSSATSRSTSRWTSTRSCACSTSASPARATTWWCRCTAPASEPERRPHQVDPRRAAVARRPQTAPHWRAARRRRRRRPWRPPSRPAVDRRRARAAGPPWAEWRRRTRRGAARRRPAPRVALRHRPGARRRRGGTTPPRRRRDPGLAKGARDLELPPWNKGRYGTAVGRAVHAVLQTVDLATGAGIDDTAAAQAAAEGVIGREDDIAALRASPLIDPTSCATRWPHGLPARDVRRRAGRRPTLEGYVDLVYRQPDGLVVVDYKTDAWADDADLDAKLAQLPPAGRVVRGRARGRPPARRWRSACSCSSAGSGGDAAGAVICRRRCVTYELLSGRPPQPPPHQHPADRAGHDHDRGVEPGPPDGGA